jgi:hypothetical protein
MLLFGVLLVMVGVQLVSTGLLGEMISSSQVGSKPHYEIRAERLARGEMPTLHGGVGIGAPTLTEVPVIDPSDAELTIARLAP